MGDSISGLKKKHVSIKDAGRLWKMLPHCCEQSHSGRISSHSCGLPSGKTV